MIKKLLLDNQEFHINPSLLPLLIHGKEGTGASLYTMSILSDLYSQHMKIIALTGYPMAREEFIKQTGDNENIGETADKKVLFLVKEKQSIFREYIKTLSDISERVILLKNIELLPEEVFHAIKDFNTIIISGDLQACQFKGEILRHPFQAKVYFSELNESLPELQKYEGYLASDKSKGIVSLQSIS